MAKNTIIYGYATGYSETDGKKRQVTVVGNLYYDKETVVHDNAHIENNEVTSFYFYTDKVKVGRLELAYSIQHGEDTNNPIEGETICIRRLRKNEAYMTFETEGNFRVSTAQAIVNAEAEHIASKIDSFIRKLQDHDHTYKHGAPFTVKKNSKEF